MLKEFEIMEKLGKNMKENDKKMEKIKSRKKLIFKKNIKSFFILIRINKGFKS
jgi:hypothetical protein